MTRHLLSSTRFAGRYLTAGRRSLPDFVIIGAQRGGTTSLYQWLGTHPRVTPAFTKEVHYFDDYYEERGIRWYRAHFPYPRSGQITGEASPYMLFHPLSPARAASDLPSTTRFIALLREPAQRAISQYWLWRKTNLYETESLDRALELEPERLAIESERVLRGERSVGHMAFSYVARGEYASQLRRWFEAVGRDRVLVLESERLYVDPTASAHVLEWMGLAPHGEPYPALHGAARPSEENAELESRLRRHFEPHNRELFELLGYELWRKEPDSPPATLIEH